MSRPCGGDATLPLGFAHHRRWECGLLPVAHRAGRLCTLSEGRPLPLPSGDMDTPSKKRPHRRGPGPQPLIRSTTALPVGLRGRYRSGAGSPHDSEHGLPALPREFGFTHPCSIVLVLNRPCARWNETPGCAGNENIEPHRSSHVPRLSRTVRVFALDARPPVPGKLKTRCRPAFAPLAGRALLRSM